MIQKITAFVLRKLPSGSELLILNHPHAGYQLPAGTVEAGEQPHTAVLREVAEETGLTDAVVEKHLTSQETLLPDHEAITLYPTAVFARPDSASFDWGRFKRGIKVFIVRKEIGYTQVSYSETDRFPDPQYITYQITGWVPDEVLTRKQVRHFYLLSHHGATPATWTAHSDNHTFSLSWAPLTELPSLTPPQDTWLTHLQNADL